MGRPRVPVIDRQDAIAKALEIIDRDGLDAMSIRNLGKEIGVNGASLYHHFKDKEEILQGVRVLVLEEAKVLLPTSRTATWQDYVRRSVVRYRAALVNHPNTAPLMTPGHMRPIGLVRRDHLVARMLEQGVPPRYCYAITDSAETLAFGSAALNPLQLPPGERFSPRKKLELPNLEAAIRAAGRSAERMFLLQLDALLAGWETVIERSADPA